MFRRAASLLDFSPRDGELVELRGKLAVYEPRGDLQLIVESMSRAGQGALFEQFLKLKAKLESEGLFDQARKRSIPMIPRGIGIVTSLGAAALHDVATALMRRAPHVPVVISPASVQGAGSPAQLASALERLWQINSEANPIDVILVVRGGGSIEDLWSFNDENFARMIHRSPIPVISGVGHETDFTLADFVSDLRAPTPTAAAELAATAQEVWHGAIELIGERLRDAVTDHVDTLSQRLDNAAARLGRPSSIAAKQRLRISSQAQRLHFLSRAATQKHRYRLDTLASAMPKGVGTARDRARQKVERLSLRLESLDPKLVLQRGYAWLTDESGHALTSTGQFKSGEQVTATLADGQVELKVLQAP